MASWQDGDGDLFPGSGSDQGGASRRCAGSPGFITVGRCGRIPAVVTRQTRIRVQSLCQRRTRRPLELRPKRMGLYCDRVHD